MTPNARRGNRRPHRPEVYWRRRLLALTGGLGMLGLLAWACSGALGIAVGGGAGPAATASPAAAKQAAHTARPAADARSPAGAGPAAGAATHPAGHRNQSGHSAPDSGSTPGSGSTADGGSAAGGGSMLGGGSAPGRQAASACHPGDLVISLFGSGTSYGPRVRPRFQVDVVNVGSRDCVFNGGSRSLRLVIMSGSDRIWSSADCPRGPAKAMVPLTRGVPYVASFSWNRTRSGPGCRAPQVFPLPGTYRATAYGGGAASPTAVFTLR